VARLATPHSEADLLRELQKPLALFQPSQARKEEPRYDDFPGNAPGGRMPPLPEPMVRDS